MIFGCDYSAGVPSVAALKAAGVQFVARYVSPGARRKDLTRAEADTMRAAGIQVVTVYEDTVGDAKQGRAGGRANATFVHDELARLGAPPEAPCYFAVDYDAQGIGITTAVDYVRGAADVLGADRTGVYGGFYVVKACFDRQACRYGWQTVAWSGGQWDDRAHIRQHLGQITIGGIECDRDYATVADYGQWDRAPRGPFMALSDAEQQEVLAAARQINGAKGAGQASFAGTVEATLATVQQLVNEGRSQSGTLGRSIADVRSAVLGALAALPPPETPEQAAETRDRLLGVLTNLGVEGLSPDALLDALQARLAA